MKKRFVVEKESDRAFWIKDTLAVGFKMPERAVSLNFKYSLDAKSVASALNREWEEFCRNPE